MHLSSLLLLSLGTTFAAPTDPELELVARGDSTRFPFPYIGESLKDYAEQLISFLSNTFIGSVDALRAVSYIAPTPSIDWNCNFHKASMKTDDLPNFDSEFYSVSGVDHGSVKWLIEAEGRTADDPVVFYVHGGGYVFGLFPMMTGEWINIWKDFNVESDRLSVLALDYWVAPKEGTWPAPLKQAAAVYNELTKTSNNIILAGDSAGGHLALSLFRHIKHPVDSVDEISKKPQGLVAWSPWVNIFPNQGNGTRNGTYVTNDGLDLLSANSLSAMGELSVPDEETRTSSTMNMWKDYIDWYDILPDDKSKIFVSYGDQEVLKGDILTWLDIAKLPNSGATIHRDLAGCEKCLFQSGTHDNVLFNLKESGIHNGTVTFLTDNFA